MAPRACAALLALGGLTTGMGVAGADEGAPAADVGTTGPDAGGPDPLCLAWLDEQGIRYAAAPAGGSMRTPIELRSPLGSLALVPRGRRRAIMDCQLARALEEARPIFTELGISALGFSAAYDNRTRRNSSQLSGHAYGLAIDVHELRGGFGAYNVKDDFEVGVGQWKGLKNREENALAACIGTPTTDRGRALRTLVCRLKLHSAFRVIVTPDDDHDHQDHLHLETFFDSLARARGIVGVFGTAPGPAAVTKPAEKSAEKSAGKSAPQKTRRR